MTDLSRPAFIGGEVDPRVTATAIAGDSGASDTLRTELFVSPIHAAFGEAQRDLISLGLMTGLVSPSPLISEQLYEGAPLSDDPAPYWAPAGVFVSVMNHTEDAPDFTVNGLVVSAETLAGNDKSLGYIHGIDAYASHLGTGDVYEIASLWGKLEVLEGSEGAISAAFALGGTLALKSAAATVEEAQGVYGDVEVYAGHVDRAFGLWSQVYKGGGTIDEAYGCFVKTLPDDIAAVAWAYYYAGGAGREWGVKPDGTIHTRFPSADPHVAGVWWDNAGTLTKSAG